MFFFKAMAYALSSTMIFVTVCNAEMPLVLFLFSLLFNKTIKKSTKILNYEKTFPLWHHYKKHCFNLSFSPLDITSHEENYQIERDVSKETGYLGDINTSSSESSEQQSSDSEDDNSSKGNIFIIRSEQIKNYLTFFLKGNTCELLTH